MSKCGGQGGAEFKVGSGAATFACNGETGFTETLPPGMTETGTWVVQEVGVPTGEIPVAFSFPIPLAEGGEEAFFLNETETSTEAGTGGCTGSVIEPTAPEGVLCVYTAYENQTNIGTSPFFVFANQIGFQPTGTVLRFQAEEAPATLQMNGSWAVTAAE